LGGGVIAPRIFNLGARWMWVGSFTPWSLYPRGKSPQYPLDSKLCGLQKRLFTPGLFAYG